MTPKQSELLKFIAAYQSANEGVFPSFDEMREALGLASKSGVHRLLTSLEEQQLVSRNHRRNRGITLVDHPLCHVASARLIAELERRGIVVSGMAD